MPKYSMLPLLILVAAAPATAQFTERPTVPSAGPPDPLKVDSRVSGPGTWRDVDEIDDRIHDQREAGRLSKRDARRLDRQAGYIGTLADRYGQDSLSDAEQRELDFRAGALRDQVGIKAQGGASRTGR